MSEFSSELKRLLMQANMPIAQDALDAMQLYYEDLVRTNEQYNLTTVTQPAEAAKKHFFDSLAPMDEIPQGAKLVDVGSGGGFPAVPLAAARSDLAVTAVESSQKKCDFIARASQEAGIRVNVVCGRVEELTRLRGIFDACVSRAVASLPVLLELCTPLLRVGGQFFAYKGDYAAELKASKNALQLLDMQHIDTITLMDGELSHHVLVFQKMSKTPRQYPRRYALIKKNPL